MGTGGHAWRTDQRALVPPEAAQKFQGLRSEMQGIATKIGELESDAEEHR